MKRFPRLVACLALIGFAGAGVSGMGLCICADGNVALEMGCHGGCLNAEDAPVGQQHGEAEMLGTACIDTCGDCVYVPLSSGAMPLSLSGARHSLWVKDLLPRTPLKRCLNDGVDFDGRANTSYVAYREPLLMSASLLAQRTIVLCI